MKVARFFFLALAAGLLSSSSAFAVAEGSELIPFRHIPAEEAFSALKERVGQTAAEAVTSIDPKQNAIVLSSSHPEAAQVREFLRTFDYRRPTVIVHATIKKVTPATATTPASVEVLSRPTIMGRPGSKMSLVNKDGIQIELVVDVAPGEVPTP